MSEIKKVNLTESLESNFARYAGMVIQDRAIVDVRDGLKPAARQLAYAQYIDKLTHDKPMKKATKSVAAGMAHFYVHGDASAYSTLIRMGKPFAMRYPLEDVQGSYGNQMENDNEAASRYVEMRLSELGTHLFDSIEKRTIEEDDWRENYDGTEIYPAVLPSIGFYNLVQGSTGIGVALASSIPQFNLKEMNAGLIKLLWNKNIDFDDIYCAPDFATGATIINGDEIKESIKNGTGPAIKLRAKIEEDYGNNQLIVTELPYGVYTNTICQQLTEAIENNPDCGIVKFLDLTGTKPLIKITLSKGVSHAKVKDFLYKNTSLQSYFGVNMVMLKDGKYPQVFGLKEAMLEYLEHSKNVLRNKTKFDLEKATLRLEIVEGYLKALSIIDQIVALIKSQSSTAAACLRLMNDFGFSERQAKAILDLKLSRLVNMEILKIEQEKENLEKEIAYYNLLLSNETEFLKVIENNLLEVSKKYGDDRRTDIINLSEDAPIIEEKLIVAYISNTGAIVAKEMKELANQKRNTLGARIKFSNKNDCIWRTLVGKNTDKVIMFTNKGQSYVVSLSDFPLNEEFYINQVVNLKEFEYVTNILTFDKAKIYKYVVFATKNGTVKKTALKEYLGSSKKSGILAIKLREDDELISTQLIENDDDKILLTTHNGLGLLIKQEDISNTGRATIGVKGINLNKNDYVCSMQVVTKDTTEVLTVTNKGYGKRTPIDEFNVATRATKGQKVCGFKDEKDTLAYMVVLNKNNEEMIINSKISSLKMLISTIPVQGKNTIGVQIIKISDTSYVKDIILLENQK